MTTTTDTPQTAEGRRQQAAEHTGQLEAELARLQRRRQEAATAVETLSTRVAQQERSGNQEALAKLRAERREANEVLADLTRAVGTVEQELSAAHAYQRAVSLACQAEAYNKIVLEQRVLTTKISEALETIVEAVMIKEGLAVKQIVISPHANFRPERIRWALLEEVTKRLEGVGHKTPLRSLDWSIRHMTSYGTLEELS